MYTVQKRRSARQRRRTQSSAAHARQRVGGRRRAPSHQDLPAQELRRSAAYVNRVGQMAEEQKHHPDIYLAWGKVHIDIWTHKLDGRTESDFVFAAKAETLMES